MKAAKALKWTMVIGWVIFGVCFTVRSSFSKSASVDKDKPASVTQATSRPDDYLGSETCKACHEDQFNSFAKTTHSHLAKAGWKNEGCESCHGPGKAHVEGGGDKTKIHTFENETPKKISDTCLGCHAGREEHNNFRRGEHWKNDVGCTDCHSPHISSHPTVEPRSDGSSSVFPVGPFAAHASDFVPNHMLKKREVLLCASCHDETTSQFNRPFHHKVLEGTMKCSDCHNPHGGFEMKQARLATGGDAACFKCHADKQGPFVFEHAPIKVEGCSACHDPHGSANPKLLKRAAVAQLCIECHSNIGVLAGEEPTGATQAPHTLTARFQNCTVCHVKIHGSNSSNRFFR